MTKRIILGLTGGALAIMAGMVVMMSLHLLTSLIYPPPEGADMMSQEPENLQRLHEWFETLPAAAFIVASACHGLGCMAGAIVAMCFFGRRSLIPALVIGVIFAGFGIMNLSSIPHPARFPFVDIPLYIIFALIGGKLLKRTDERRQFDAGYGY